MASKLLNLQEEKKPARVFEPQYTKCPWLESADMKRWREEELPKKERAKCLVLVDPRVLERRSGQGICSPRSIFITAG